MTGDAGIEMSGTRVSISHGLGGARVLDGIEVRDPENPDRTHGVTMDHEIMPNGDVYFEVNAEPISLLVT